MEYLTKFDIIKKAHIIDEDVKAVPLMDIVEEAKISKFDYVQVDTERYNYKVVHMFDFLKDKPKIIKAEYVNFTPEEKKKMNYHLYLQGLDIIRIDLNKIKL